MSKIFNLVKFIFTVLTIGLSLGADCISQELTSEQIYENVNDAVVVVISYDFNGNMANQGSGVVLNDKGYVVTNYHVFAECERLEIKHYDKIIRYTDIIGADVEKDILILKIEDNTFPSIPMADVANLKVGQRVYAIGSPLGLENSMSEGIISGLRNVDELRRNFIQITASISPGSSGGAVVNSKGELIGISTLSVKGGQNLNFAIPVNDILLVQISSYSDKKSIESNNLYYKGFNAYYNGKYSEAVEFLSEYIKLNPDKAKGYYDRGSAYGKLGKFAEAISDFTLAIDIKPDDAEAYLRRGVSYGKSAKYTEAISDFTRSIKIIPDSSKPYFNRGEVYYELGKYSEAVSDYTLAIKIKPDFAEAYNSRGYAYDNLGKYNEAISDFTKAIIINPKDTDSYSCRGSVYGKLRKYNDAISDFTHAININPNYVEAYRRRGYSYFAMNECYNAIKDWEKAIELNPGFESELKTYINRCK